MKFTKIPLKGTSMIYVSDSGVTLQPDEGRTRVGANGVTHISPLPVDEILALFAPSTEASTMDEYLREVSERALNPQPEDFDADPKIVADILDQVPTISDNPYEKASKQRTGKKTVNKGTVKKEKK